MGHNFVLALLAEIRVVRLVLFLAIIVVGVPALATHRRRGAARKLWLTVLVAWTFAALLHNWEYRKLTW